MEHPYNLDKLGWACPSPDQMAPDDLKGLLNAVQSAGYLGIEPLIHAPYKTPIGFLQKELKERGLSLIGVRTGAITQQTGFTLSDPDPAIRREAVSSLSEVIKYASEFGKPKILVGLIQGRLQPGVSKEAALDWIISGLNECAQIASQHGLLICLEPVNRSELGYNRTAAEIFSIITKLDSPSIKMLLDTFHMDLEEENPIEVIHSYQAFLGHIHLADSDRKPPGKGTINFSEFFNALQVVNYQGELTIECNPWPDPLTALQTSASFVRSKLQCQAGH